MLRKPYDVRHAYYRDVEKRRGKGEMDRLIAEVNRQWKEQQPQHKKPQQPSGQPQHLLDF